MNGMSLIAENDSMYDRVVKEVKKENNSEGEEEKQQSAETV